MFESIERTIISKDWLTLLFLISFCLLVLIRFVFRKQFSLFLVFLFSNKYENQFISKQDDVVNWFSSLLFLIQIISITIFSYVAIIFFHPSLVDAPFLFVKIITFTTFFIIIKYILEKIIAVILDLETHVNTYNFHKLSIRNLFGIILIPVNLVLVYYTNGNKIIFFSVILTFFLYNLIGLFLLLKNYQNLIISKLFYFILYLCALEIAPYLVMYKFLVK
ncbi:DUF4271 domain-containing protein [uncultured Kordia sp.]|uniref:DUF4271 domain-containing protein n=1 Tax=uncultured Kordia sp. TaxID=507699 RepID=UPI00344F7346